MTGPLAQQFAQVREALDEICPQEYVIDCDLPEHQTARDGHAALSAIERHVQDMEKASLTVGYECAHKHRWWMAPNETPRGCPICNTITFAALPASGTQTAANAGRNQVAREKGEK